MSRRRFKRAREDDDAGALRQKGVQESRGSLSDLRKSRASPEAASPVEEFEALFSVLIDSIPSNQDFVKLNLGSCGIDILGLNNQELKYFFYNVILKHSFLVAFDDDSTTRVSKIIKTFDETKKEERTFENKVKTDLLKNILSQFEENKKPLIDLCCDIANLFKNYRDTRVEIEVEKEELLCWQENLPFILEILAKKPKEIKDSEITLREFKNFAKNALSEEEKGRLASEGKSEIEIIKEGLQRRLTPAPEVEVQETQPLSPRFSQEQEA